MESSYTGGLRPRLAPRTASVAREADLDFRRVLLEDFAITCNLRDEGHGHGNVPYSDTHILLRVRVQVDADGATGLEGDRSAEAASIAALEEPALDFRGEDVNVY